jgi:hypothetical protein
LLRGQVEVEPSRRTEGVREAEDRYVCFVDECPDSDVARVVQFEGDEHFEAAIAR